jgi:hypothetical protein
VTTHFTVLGKDGLLKSPGVSDRIFLAGCGIVWDAASPVELTKRDHRFLHRIGVVSHAGASKEEGKR